MVGSHVIENFKKIILLAEFLLNIDPMVWPIFNGLCKLTFRCRDYCFKIHEVFSQSASLIEAAKAHVSTSYHLVFLNAENGLFLEFAD